MDNTTAVYPRVPCLSSMPPEVLQEIFWHSLELSLCLASKRIYQTLPRYQRLARFLPLLAFGSGLSIDKIVDNAGDDCSDVIRQLAIITPLSDEDRMLLQQRILESAWFQVSSFLDISRAVEEYAVQRFWIDRGIETEPEHLDHFVNRHSRKAAYLKVLGLDEDGACHLLVAGPHSVIVRPCTGGMIHRFGGVDVVRLLHIRYIPNKLLQSPLPRSRSPLRPLVFNKRLTRPMPDFFRFLNERYLIEDNNRGHFMISSAAIEHAVSEAISAYNHYFLEAIIPLPMSADGKTRLQIVTAAHFIAAAQLLDAKAIELLWRKSYSPYTNDWPFTSTRPSIAVELFSPENTGIFPFENNDVIAWMEHAAREAQQSPCSNLAFIHYIKYFWKALHSQPYLGFEEVAAWRHEPDCKCIRKSHSKAQRSR